MSLPDWLSRVLDALWQQIEPLGESILREAVHRLPLRQKAKFLPLMGSSPKLWSNLSRNILEVTKEKLDAAIAAPVASVQRAMARIRNGGETQ